MKPTQFPKGWDQARADALIAELDAMSDADWAVWDDAAMAEDADRTTISVPRKLLPEIRKLMAGDRSANEKSTLPS